MDRQKRIRSWQETQSNVRRAKQLTERYGYDEAHPDGYLQPLPANEQDDWASLLKRMK